jgi:hypothetical protein
LLHQMQAMSPQQRHQMQQMQMQYHMQMQSAPKLTTPSTPLFPTYPLQQQYAPIQIAPQNTQPSNQTKHDQQESTEGQGEMNAMRSMAAFQNVRQSGSN